METSIELGYAGVVIGRVTVAGDIDESSLFLPVSDPLPVGTKVSLKIDGRAAEGRVIGVLETAEPGKAGMRVRVGPAISATAAATVAAPAPAPAPAPPPAAAAPAVDPAPAPVAAEASAPAAEVAAEESQATDGTGDGIPTSGEDVGGNSGPNAAGGGGGGRRKRRRR